MINQRSDYSQLEFIYDYEKNISIPVKWTMLLACFILTYYLNREIIFEAKFLNGYLLMVALSLIFTVLYSIPNLKKYVKLISFFSFAHDIFFVSFLLQFTKGIDSPLHIVYCIFIIRAAINYPSVREMLLVCSVIFSPIYFYGLYLVQGSFSFLAGKDFLVLYLFLMLVFLSSFGVVYLINKQKEKIEKNLQEIKNLQAQLIQSGKLSGIGQLAAGVAHEINNPLANILGFTQLLLRDMPAHQLEKREDFLKIEKSAIRCKRIIESLLKFSHQTDFELLPTNINQVIEDTLQLVGHQLDISGIKVTTNLQNGFPKILVDASQIQQVMVNIILNAIDAMPKGGELKIETCLTIDHISVKISDTGRGISPEDQGKIFEPFFTTKEVGSGVGLGLSIAYGIISKHKGAIKVMSKIGKGTTFEILLPTKENNTKKND